MPDLRLPYRFSDGETIDRERVLEDFREIERTVNALGPANFGSVPLSAILTDAGLVQVTVPLTGVGVDLLAGNTYDVHGGVALGGEWRLKEHRVAVDGITLTATLTVTIRRDGVAQGAATVTIAAGDITVVPGSKTADGLDIAWAEGQVTEILVVSGGVGTIDNPRSILTWSRQMS